MRRWSASDEDLATLTYNTAYTGVNPLAEFAIGPRPTLMQIRVFELLGSSLNCSP